MHDSTLNNDYAMPSPESFSDRLYKKLRELINISEERKDIYRKSGMSVFFYRIAVPLAG